MNDLELLRDWPAGNVRPSAEVRAHARARLEHAYTGISTAPTPAVGAGRRFGKRLAIAGLAAAVLMAGAIVWAQREVDDRLDRIKTVAVPNDVLGGGEIGHGPVNILVVGSDLRDGSNPAAFGSPADTGPQRADTLILLHIDGSSVHGMWIPRDLLVGPSPGVQINSTFNKGPAALIAAIRSDLGVEVDHYVEIGFTGFPRIVDALGGVTIFSPGPARDAYTGLDLPARGCVDLNGMQALQWVRARHLEIFENGQWIDANPRADLDRLERQQEFVRALARRAKQVAGDDPRAAVDLVDALIPALTVDSQFTRAELLGLVRVIRNVDPADLQLATVPVQAAPDGAHVVLAQPAADEAFAPFRGEPGRESPVPLQAPVGRSTAPAPEC